MKAVKNRTTTDVSVNIDAMPAHESDALCRTLIGCVSRLFENPAVQADYKRWKQHQKEKEHNHDK